MQLSDTQLKIAGLVVVVAVIVLGYFIWSRSVVPEPTIPAGQTIQNPLGQTGPGGPGAPGAAAASAAAPPQGATPGGQMGTPVIPRAGTVDPRMGFGPSPGAPIPGNR